MSSVQIMSAHIVKCEDIAINTHSHGMHFTVLEAVHKEVTNELFIVPRGRLVAMTMVLRILVATVASGCSRAHDDIVAVIAAITATMSS